MQFSKSRLLIAFCFGILLAPPTFAQLITASDSGASHQPLASGESAFMDAVTSFRAGRFPAAFGRFIALANAGHPAAAGFALFMCSHATDLFGEEWDCGPEQVDDWSAAARSAALDPNIPSTEIGGNTGPTVTADALHRTKKIRTDLFECRSLAEQTIDYLGGGEAAWDSAESLANWCLVSRGYAAAHIFKRTPMTDASGHSNSSYQIDVAACTSNAEISAEFVGGEATTFELIGSTAKICLIRRGYKVLN